MSQPVIDIYPCFSYTYSKLMANNRTHTTIVQVFGELGIVKDLLQDTFRKLKLDIARLAQAHCYTRCILLHTWFNWRA